MRRMMARISSFALSNDPFPSKANNSEFQVQLNKPDSRSCAVAKRENFWQATGQSWYTNGWPRQKLLVLTQLHSSQWSSLAFSLPSLIV